MPSYDPQRNPKDLVSYMPGMLLPLQRLCNMFLVPQISYMEKDMDLGLANVLCAKVDEHAGDWPSQSFVDLFHIANKCVQPKMSERAEVAEVSTILLHLTMSRQPHKQLQVLLDTPLLPMQTFPLSSFIH